MPEAVATREAAGLRTAYGDVWDGLLDPSLVPEYELGIASPPCQTFSAAGNGSGRRALDDVLRMIDEGAHKLPGDGLRKAVEAAGMDERTGLVLAPLAYFWRDRPAFIALEQVPAVLPVWAAYAEVLEEIGYSVAYANLQAEQYGVPQTRKRAILVARRDGAEVSLPTPTHSRYYSRDPKRLDEGVLPWVSMAEALGMGLLSRPSPTVTGGGTETGGAEPIAKLRRYTDTDDWKLRSNYGTNGDPAKRGEREAAEPAPTITSKASRMLKVESEKTYVNGNRPNSARRPVSAPAPTVHFGERANEVTWQEGERPQGWGLTERPAVAVGNAVGRGLIGGSGAKAGIVEAIEGGRFIDSPHGDGSSYAEKTRITVEEAAILQSFPPYSLREEVEEWRWKDAPATTVAGDPRITSREHHSHGEQNSTSLRLEEGEMVELQTFQRPFPFQGTKTKRYLQIGNAIPPLLAEAILATLTDRLDTVPRTP